MLERPISKAGWTRVAFGDVVRLSKARVADPEAAGIERVVGLEHIEPGDLRIRRWGDVADGTTFTTLFKPGQVLFGKRRAYQRKVAVADFEGVCSGDIYVLEPANGRLMPELLPFLCQTDAFFDHAVGTSAGSLSPRTNWTSLASFEFLLPPIQEQARLVEALSAAVNAKDALDDAAHWLSISQLASLDSLMRGLDLGETRQHPQVGRFFCGWEPVYLADLLILSQYGLSEEATSSGRYPMLRMMNVEAGKVVENDLKYIDLPDTEFQRYRLLPGDVLFNRTNSYELVGRTGTYDLEGEHVFASYLVRLRANDDLLLPEYLTAFLNCEVGRRQVMAFATRGVSQANVNASSLQKVVVPLPPIEHQRKVVEIIDTNRASLTALKARSNFIRDLISRIANGGFSE
nr:restriction endonuclease subunit S [Brevundimonas diminuta]